MKILNKYNRVNLIAIIVITLITGGIYHQAISLILINEKAPRKLCQIPLGY